MLKYKIIAIIFFATILINPISSLHQSAVFAGTDDVDPSYVEEGVASWYGPKFHGRKTASGEIFDTHDFTAAHKTLPFGTYVKVTNLQNNLSTVVRINDRGPYVKGRIIDLSHAAKQDIEMGSLAKVRIEIFDEDNENLSDFENDLFDKSGLFTLFGSVLSSGSKIFIEYKGVRSNENSELTEEELIEYVKNSKSINIAVLAADNSEVATYAFNQKVNGNKNYIEITNILRSINGYTLMNGEFDNIEDVNELIGNIKPLEFYPLILEEIYTSDTPTYKLFVGRYDSEDNARIDMNILNLAGYEVKCIQIFE